MASPMSQKLEEKLVCSICLELFRVPVTLPCGHNFCKRCISDHWDKQKQAAGTEGSCSCPECRRGFERCPELKKNVTLHSVVELARDSEERGSAAGRCEVAPAELCRQHGRPLELYCENERRCICCICTVRDCQRHRRVLFEEERAKKQTFLKESLEKAQEESERIEQTMKELELQTESIKDCSELKDGIQSKFTHLKKALEDFQCQTVARIEQEQRVALEHVDKNWNLCKDRLDVLGQHMEKAQSLLACPDHRSFLQEFPLFPPLESPEVLVPVEFDVAAVIKPISEILTSISRLLLEDLPACVAPKAPNPAGQGPVHPQELVVKAVDPLPKCQLRAELLKGKEHRGPGGDSTSLGYPAQRDATKPGSFLGGGWLWLQGQELLPWFFQCVSLNAEKGGLGSGWMGWDGKGPIRGIRSTRNCFPMELRLSGIGSVTALHGIAPVQSPACSHCSLSRNMASAFLAIVLHVPFPPQASHPLLLGNSSVLLFPPPPCWEEVWVMFRPCWSCHSCQGVNRCL
nr:tripartite motif-containing protein 65 isoform X1 [Taeniopygia guttata]